MRTITPRFEPRSGGGVERAATIYGLVDPRDGVLRYLGVTFVAGKARANAHAAGGVNPKVRKDFWLTALRLVGLRAEYVEIAVVPEPDGRRVEELAIASARAWGYPILNESDRIPLTDDEVVAAYLGDNLAPPGSPTFADFRDRFAVVTK